MGAWGYGIYENDTAMDCRDTFEKSIREGKGTLEALNDLKQGWAFQYNESILAIADIQIDITGSIDEFTKKKATKALLDEIEKVNEWKSPNERMDALNQFKIKLEKY